MATDKTFGDYLVDEARGNVVMEKYLKEKGIDYLMIKDKVTQKKGIDARVGSCLVDFKYDYYKHDDVIVGEVRQKDGTTWLDSKKDTEKVWYCHLHAGKVLILDFKKLLAKVDFSKYKQRNTTHTGAIICLIPLEDIEIEDSFDLDFSELEKYFQDDKWSRENVRV